MSGKVVSTIGYERRHNSALKPRTLEQFVQFIQESLPAKPADFEAIRQANLAGIGHREAS